MFGLYVRLVGAHVAPERHLLTDDAGPQEIVRRLERQGAGKHAKIVVPEGFTRFDIARRLQAAHVATQVAFLEATTDATLLREVGVTGDSVEGMLFPATYDMALDSDPRELVRRMKTEFDRRFLLLEETHRLGIAQLEGAFGLTKRDIVTLASLVEKEAAVDEERPIIASVLNRLRDLNFAQGAPVRPDRRGTDASCCATASRVRGLHGEDHARHQHGSGERLQHVRARGLPPGPIAKPGTKSLQAVLAPASTKYLYFVARGENRRHTFSETVEEHNTAVKEFRDRVGGRRDGPVRE